MRIIGIDASVEPTKTGLVKAERTAHATRIEVAQAASDKRKAADIVSSWLTPKEKEPVLIAIDSPLGWPEALAPALACHTAGAPLLSKREATFARATERRFNTRFVVGADKIAKTAHESLRLLASLRKSRQIPIPLAWTPARVDKTSVIEVYPAATLKAHCVENTGYKEKKGKATRTRIVKKFLEKPLIFCESATAEQIRTSLEEDEHILDAAVCAVAAADFLAGCVVRPDDDLLARLEGWIWVNEHWDTCGRASLNTSAGVVQRRTRRATCGLLIGRVVLHADGG